MLDEPGRTNLLENCTFSDDFFLKNFFFELP